MPGRYTADIIVFQVQGAGSDHRIDAVYPGFAFQIEAVWDSSNYIEWNQQHWGSIRLDDNEASTITSPE